MLRTASIQLNTTSEQGQALAAMRAAYAEACNRLVPAVTEHRCWNRVALHHHAYSRLRADTHLGSQMTCNAIFSVCKAYQERRRVKHINHETSKSIVAEALRQGMGRIVMEDLTHIRTRIKAGKRMRARLHRWAFRQLQTFVEYKARAAGIEVVYVDPAYTSQTCSDCSSRGNRVKHRFVCDQCGLRAHADLNASRNLARIGGAAASPRAVVNTPHVGNVGRGIHVLQ